MLEDREKLHFMQVQPDEWAAARAQLAQTFTEETTRLHDEETTHV
jgi:hypothetical protein